MAHEESRSVNAPVLSLTTTPSGNSLVLLWMFLNFLLLIVLGLASGRLLYEWLFPRLLWLAYPTPTILVALVIATVASLLLQRTLKQPRLVIALFPLLLNLAYFFDPTVDPIRGRFLFFATLWLSAVLFTSWRPTTNLQSPISNLQSPVPSSTSQFTIHNSQFIILILLTLLPVYLLTMSHAVGQADTFEFQVVAPQLGIAHPTGYPLYLLLGKLFTLLPLSSVAWRMNFASAVYALITITLIYQLARRLMREPGGSRYGAVPRTSWFALSALIAAVALGLSPTFWSQAIVAEVYTLHALLVALALTLMVALLSADVEPDSQVRLAQERLALLLAFVCGLALTNHLTAVFLLPGAAVAILVVIGRGMEYRPPTADRRPSPSHLWSAVSRRLSFVIRLGLAFATPLLLYAYLPLRWQAVNHEPMGLARFVDWVVGGRFQSALQWNAWLNDPTRFEVIGRLFLQNWGWPYLLLALIGFIFLLRRQRLVALVLFLTWFGFNFYTLNYYVPDLAVFLIPAHLIIALCLAVGIAECGLVIAEIGKKRLRDWRLETRDLRLETRDLRLETRDSQSPNLPVSRSPRKSTSGVANLQSPISSSNSQLTIDNSPFTIFLLLCALPAIWLAINNWSRISQAGEDGLLRWGAGVLAMPLDDGAAILADSEKIAPLYYLQQAEGVRPDLGIMVLPDEASYRAELDGRVAAGQTVYLARFLPGLAGVYHLRSVGPLVEASNEPLEKLPSNVTTADLQIGPLQLLGYTVEPSAAIDANATAVTLYWRKAADADPGSAPVIYLRWATPSLPISQSPISNLQFSSEGQHPIGNNYPINAWKGSEIVPDYHLLPHPLATCRGEATGQDVTNSRGHSLPVAPPLPATCHLPIEVAIGPPYTPAADLDWQPITTVTLPATTGPIDGRPYRAQFSSFLLETAAFPSQLRRGSPLEVQYRGYGDGETLEFMLRPIGNRGEMVNGQWSTVNGQLEGVYVEMVDTMVESGRYHLIATSDGGTAVCGWLQPIASGCTLGEVEISGVPLASSATNFDDKIALLKVNLQQETLQSGGQLSVGLTWQSLAAMNENYTVFVQVLDEQDRIVGQVDAWPVQGTYPTSQWQMGEVVHDPYTIQLKGELSPGPYRLHIGWYLLATLRRLPVLDDKGTPVDDKLVIEGLLVP